MFFWPFSKRMRTVPNSVSSYICNFCGRPPSVVGRMVEGPNQVYICAHCVSFAHQIAEANSSAPTGASFDDPNIRWTGHMHIRCYFHLHKSDGSWRATATEPTGMEGVGASPQEATRNLQAAILSATARQFALGEPVSEYFVNHTDKRLRVTPAF